MDTTIEPPTVTERGRTVNAEVFLGRQPIVDADRQVFGFEVLYRDGPGRTSSFDDPEAATRGVMERIFLQWGMEHLVGDHFGLLNASASLVVRGLHRAMPPEGMIIEIREPEPFDEATVDALQQARYAGYHFALDNVNRLGDLEQSRLLPLASLVKIELTTAHDAEIPRLISVARDRSPGILVVAEKVESVADFKRCVEHGFDLFQGYYLAEPEVLRRPARPAGTRSATALYVALLDDEPGIDVGRLETIMASDPSLAFRLLTAVNASAFGLDRNVGSLEQAMGLLGPDRLRCLAELIALSGDTIDDDIHIERGAVRARMAAALLADTDLAGSGITVALLSTADCVYGAPMAELLTELPVTDEITSALLHGHGRLGTTLDIIRACERDDRATLDDLAPGRHAELIALREAAVNGLTNDDPVRR
jgi:EAL and modified HD-GYP domain-containing signal transduction protein